jgi:hypothetical protein
MDVKAVTPLTEDAQHVKAVIPAIAVIPVKTVILVKYVMQHAIPVTPVKQRILVYHATPVKTVILHATHAITV